jgi:hypothetical protein
MKKPSAILSLPRIGASCNYVQTSQDIKPSFAKKMVAILMLVFFSVQLISAQKVKASGLLGAGYRFYPEKVMAGVTNINRSNNILAGGFDSGKGSKTELPGDVMALTSIPFLITVGGNKKTAFLLLTKEKGCIGITRPQPV